MALVLNEADGTRFKIIFLLIGAVVYLCTVVLILAALGVPAPDLVAAAAIGGLMTQLGNSVPAFFKGREEIQNAKIESEKACAPATAASATAVSPAAVPTVAPGIVK